MNYSLYYRSYQLQLPHTKHPPKISNKLIIYVHKIETKVTQYPICSMHITQQLQQQ